MFQDFEYTDHPCSGEAFIDNLVYSRFSFEDIEEEYCFHVSKDKILNKKKYYIFRLKNIKNKKLMLKLLKIVIKKLNLIRFKKEIYNYVLSESGIDLNNLFFMNLNKIFKNNQINNFIIKVDRENNFGLYVSCIEKNSEIENTFGRSISIKNGEVVYKLYKVTKYYLEKDNKPRFFAEEINLNNNKLESKYTPIDHIFSNKNFKSRYLTKETDGSIGFYYRRIANNQISNKINVLRIYF